MAKFSLLIVLLAAVVALADGDFAKHDAYMYQLLGKINANETAVKTLLKEADEEKDPAKSKEIVAEIKKNLKERKENIKKYNKEYNHVLYEHPGQMNYPSEEKDEKKEGGHEKKAEGGEHGKEGEAGHGRVRYKRYDEKRMQEFEDETNKLLSNVYQDIKNKYNSN